MPRRRLALSPWVCAFVCSAVLATGCGESSTPVPAPAGGEAAALVRDLAEGDAAARRRAAVGLAELYPSGARAVPVLTAALEDDDPGVREAASDALLSLGEEGIEHLCRFLHKAGDPQRDGFLGAISEIGMFGAEISASDVSGPASGGQVRVTLSLLGLAYLGPDSRIAAETLLLAPLTEKGGGEPEDRATAAAALAVLGARAAADVGRRLEEPGDPAGMTSRALLETMSSAEPIVRWGGTRLAESLGVVDGSILSRLEQLVDDRAPAAGRYGPRAAACELLDKLGRAPARDDDLDRLRAQLSSPPSRAGIQAAWRLAWHGVDAERVIPTLVYGMGKAQNQIEYENTMRALASYGPAASKAVPALRRELRSERPRRRRAAAAALCRIDPDDEESPTARDGALFVLGASLREPPPRGSNEHAWRLDGLSRITSLGPAARPLAPTVAEIMKGQTGPLALEGLRALLAIGAEPEILVPVLTDSLRAIGNLPPQPGVEVFRRIVREGQPAVDAGRTLVVRVLEALAPSGPAAADALPMLESLRTHTDARIRYLAVRAIRRIGPR